MILDPVQCHILSYQPNEPVRCHVLSRHPEWSCPLSCFVMSAGLILSDVMFPHVSRNEPVRCHVLSRHPEWSCPLSCFVMLAGLILSDVMFPHVSRNESVRCRVLPQCRHAPVAQQPTPKYSSILIALCGWNGDRAGSAGQSTKNRVTMSLFCYKWSDLWSEFPFSVADSNTRDDHGHAIVTLGAQRVSFLFTALGALIVAPVAYTYRELTVVKQHSRNNI